MKSFCLVWSTLLDSTLWVNGSKEARLVWIVLLALKDKKGEIHTTIAGLSHRARVSFDECKAAIDFLCSEDPYSQNPEEGGRRIVPIEGGWRVVSHDKYRFSTEAARAYWREAKRVSRAKKQERADLPGELAYLRAERAGATEEQKDRIIDEITETNTQKNQAARRRKKNGQDESPGPRHSMGPINDQPGPDSPGFGQAQI